MGVYIVKDLNNRTLLTIDFPLVGPGKLSAPVRGGDGRQLGRVLTGVWTWSEYFDLEGVLVGILKPPMSPLSPTNAPMHFEGKQRGAMQIRDNTNIHWASDITRVNSFDNLPLTARIISGWAQEDSRLIEENAPSGQPFGYVIDGADHGRMLATGMAVFAFEVMFSR